MNRCIVFLRDLSLVSNVLTFYRPMCVCACVVLCCVLCWFLFLVCVCVLVCVVCVRVFAVLVSLFAVTGHKPSLFQELCPAFKSLVNLIHIFDQFIGCLQEGSVPEGISQSEWMADPSWGWDAHHAGDNAGGSCERCATVQYRKHRCTEVPAMGGHLQCNFICFMFYLIVSVLTEGCWLR